MRTLLIRLAAVMCLQLFATLAIAQTTGHTTSTVNLRAGPGTNYPAVTSVPEGSPISIYGCQTNYDWCDVSWGPTRGWIASTYILVDADGGRTVLTPTLAGTIGISIIVFNQANYWNLYYTHYPWYATWYHGVHPVHPVHPVPGPYCYHAPQAPECHGYRPVHPYHPYYNHPYHPYYHGPVMAPHVGGIHRRVR